MTFQCVTVWPVQGSTWQLLKIWATPKEWYPSRAESYAPLIFFAHQPSVQGHVHHFKSHSKEMSYGWMIEIPLMTGINYRSQLVFVWIFPPPINSTVWNSMDGYNFHFGPPGLCFFGGQAGHIWKRASRVAGEIGQTASLLGGGGKCRFLLRWRR